jgi:hypothetical protein
VLLTHRSVSFRVTQEFSMNINITDLLCCQSKSVYVLTA